MNTRLLGKDGLAQRVPRRRKSLSAWFAERRLLWRRLPVVIAVLLVSAVVAYGGVPPIVSSAALYGPFLIVGALILLRWPPIGLVILVAGMLVGNVNLPPVGLSMVLLIVLSGLWLLDMVGRQRKVAIIRSSTFVPLLVLSVVALLAFGVGQLPWYPTAAAPISAQIAGVTIIVLSGFAYLLAAHHLRESRWLEVITFVFLGITAVYLTLRLLPGGGTYIRQIFPGKALGSLFWVWMVAHSFSQAAFNKTLRGPMRLLLAAMTIVALYVGFVLARSWTSGWLPAVAAFIVIFVLGSRRMGLALSALGGLGMLFVGRQLFERLVLGDNEYSALTRLEAWRIVAEIVRVNPILGLGPANYYYYTPLFPILGWSVQFNSHNNYVDLVAQTGILGLLCFFWFVWSVASLCLRLLGRVPKGGFEHAYILAGAGGLAGMVVAGLLGDWVLPFVYNIGLEGLRSSLLGWLFLGGLVALEQRLKQTGMSAAGNNPPAKDG